MKAAESPSPLTYISVFSWEEGILRGRSVDNQSPTGFHIQDTGPPMWSSHPCVLLLMAHGLLQDRKTWHVHVGWTRTMMRRYPERDRVGGRAWPCILETSSPCLRTIHQAFCLPTPSREYWPISTEGHDASAPGNKGYEPARSWSFPVPCMRASYVSGPVPFHIGSKPYNHPTRQVLSSPLYRRGEWGSITDLTQGYRSRQVTELGLELVLTGFNTHTLVPQRLEPS